MKKLKFLIVIIMIILLGIFLKKGELLFKYDFGTTIELHELDLKAVDNEGNFYGVYINEFPEPQSYVMKVTPSNEIEFAIALRDSTQKVETILIDENGQVYIQYINYVYDMIRIASEEIVMYTPKGKEIRGVFKHKYVYDFEDSISFSSSVLIRTFARIDAMRNALQMSVQEKLRFKKDEVFEHHVEHPLYEVGLIKNVELKTSADETKLYVHSLEVENQITVKAFDVEERTYSVINSIEISDLNDVLKVKGHELGEMWYITSDGSLYSVDYEGNSHFKLIDSNLENYVIFDLLMFPKLNEKIYLKVVTKDGQTTIYEGMDSFNSIINLNNAEQNIFANSNGLYYMDSNGIVNYDETKKYNGSLKVSNRYFTWQVLYINAIILFVVLILLLIFLFYIHYLKKRLSIVLKQSILMIIIFSVFAIIMIGFIEQMFEEQFEFIDGDIFDAFERMIDKKMADPDVLEFFIDIKILADIKANDLKRIRIAVDQKDHINRVVLNLKTNEIVNIEGEVTFDELNKIVDQEYSKRLNDINALPSDSNILLNHIGIDAGSCFIALYDTEIIDNQFVYASTIVNTDDSEPVRYVRDIYEYVGNQEDQQAYLDNKFVSNISNDGKWLRSGKLYSYKGNSFIFRIGMNMEGCRNVVAVRKVNALDSTMKILILLAAGLLLISIKYNLHSIGVLTKFVSDIDEYDQAPSIEIKSKDEIGDLSKAFNDMLKDIKAKFLEQIKIYKVYSKYVPKEYQTYLGKDILDLELGDFCEEEMTVMYFYVHEMFEVIESFGNQKHAFMFIKEYLDDISKIIREHDGVVTKYDDGGITAIFEDNEKAVKASSEITNEVKKINGESKTKIKVGIGLNRGDLLLGIVGDESRMQLSVISKHSNIALDLAKRALGYSANILMTDEVKKKSSHNEHVRYLGYILPLNSEQEIMIYDLYSSDHEEDFDNKEATKDIFDEGIQLYQAGDFMKARYQFRKVIDVNHDDLVAQKYYFLADEYKLKSKNEIPHWSPILK